jgi:hypothetical protein
MPGSRSVSSPLKSLSYEQKVGSRCCKTFAVNTIRIENIDRSSSDYLLSLPSRMGEVGGESRLEGGFVGVGVVVG